MTTGTAEWTSAEMDASRHLPADPLLACLLLISRRFERPITGESLLSGLPLVEGRLTPALFVRAAARAGLASRLAPRPLDAIDDDSLPAVLLLKGRRACVLIGRPEPGRLEIQSPELEGLPNTIDASALADSYLGQAILVRPQPRHASEIDGDDAPPSGSWFWRSMARYAPIYYQALMAAVMINFFALALPLFTMNVYDRVVPNAAFETLWVLAIGVGLALAFDFGLRTLRGYLIDLAGQRAEILLSKHIFARVLDIQLASRPVSSGAFAATMREFDTLRDFFAAATLAVIVDLPFTFLFLALIAFLAGGLVIVPLLAIPLVIGAGWLVEVPLQRVYAQAQRSMAQKHGLLIEAVAGLETIKSLECASRMQRAWEVLVGTVAGVGLESRFLSGLAVNISIAVQQLAAIGIIVAGVYRIEDGALSMGALVAASMLAGRALAPLTQVASLLTRYTQSRAALKALDGVMAMPGEHEWGKRVLHRRIENGAIEFRNVQFGYPGSMIDSLNGVSFQIRPGERVGLIGRIGSGKSTIARLILNLYQPKEGAVLVDGIDVRQIDPADLRRAIGYVPQDVLLFLGTVRENIALRIPDADDEMVLKAAWLGGVEDFVARHPQGYELMVGERGERLSGGQRQAVANARAVIGEPPILILDEPTSGFDSTSEARFRERMGSVLAGRTLILITHRASLLDFVDRLIVMDGGKIVADGPRDAVVAALADGKIRGIG